jgi:hypothetical protein
MIEGSLKGTQVTAAKVSTEPSGSDERQVLLPFFLALNLPVRGYTQAENCSHTSSVCTLQTRGTRTGPKRCSRFC